MQQQCMYSQAPRCLRNGSERVFPMRSIGMDRMGAPPGARGPWGPRSSRDRGVGGVRARSSARASGILPEPRRFARIGARGVTRALVVPRGVRRPAHAARTRAPARFTPANLVGHTARATPRALTGFAGYYRPGCSCTPEAPRSFCATPARTVFTHPALSPPRHLS